MRRLTHLFVLAAFIFSCGGQWYALQCVAWVKMIHDYSQMVPLTDAVSMTFSGKYPCSICQAIAEKKASDDRAKILAIEKYGKKFFPPLAVAVITPAAMPLHYMPFCSRLLTRGESPPTPPPRPVLG